MKKAPIPTLLLTVTTTGCGVLDMFKSDEQIAEDICNLTICDISDENQDYYDLDEYVQYCVDSAVDQMEYFNEAYPDCVGVMRDYYLCASNLDCGQIGTEEFCLEEYERANDCMY